MIVYLAPGDKLNSKDIRGKVEDGDIFFMYCKKYSLSPAYDYAAFHLLNRAREEKIILEVRFKQ